MMPETRINWDNLRVKMAEPADIPLLARLLPQGLRIPALTRYLVAKTVGGESLGGVYLLSHTSPEGKKLMAFQMNVSSGEAEEPVRTLLLRAAIVQARMAGVQSLVVDGMVMEGSAYDRLLRSYGFRLTQTLTDYQVALSKIRAACIKVLDLLKRRDKIPATARILALSEAPGQTALHLIQRRFGMEIPPPAHHFLPEISTVVQDGPRVIGVVVAVEKKGSLHVPHTAVDEKFRQSWVTPALWHRLAQKGYAAGYDSITFSTSKEDFRRMANFAARINAVPSGNHVRLELAVSYGQELAI